jgi:hypothetical protein
MNKGARLHSLGALRARRPAGADGRCGASLNKSVSKKNECREVGVWLAEVWRVLVEKNRRGTAAGMRRRLHPHSPRLLRRMAHPLVTKKPLEMPSERCERSGGLSVNANETLPRQAQAVQQSRAVSIRLGITG